MLAHVDTVLANKPTDEFRTMINVSRGLLPMYHHTGELGIPLLDGATEELEISPGTRHSVFQ